MELIKEKLNKFNNLNGIVFDGFPRTLHQAKQLDKLENRIEFLQDRLLDLATRADVQDALLKLKANDPDRKLLKVTNQETGNVKLRVVTRDGSEIKDVKLSK